MNKQRKNITERQRKMIGFDEIIEDDYTVEIYRADGKWLQQAYVTNDYDEAEKYAEENPLENGEYYSIFCIQYDNETGEEMCSYPIY